jgi:hypothetical protein
MRTAQDERNYHQLILYDAMLGLARQAYAEHGQFIMKDIQLSLAAQDDWNAHFFAGGAAFEARRAASLAILALELNERRLALGGWEHDWSES